MIEDFSCAPAVAPRFVRIRCLMPDPLLYLLALGTAVVVSAACVWAMTRLRPDSNAWWNSAGILGMGTGLVAGYAVLAMRSAWPPVNGLDRFLMIVVPATFGIELIAGVPSVPLGVGWFLRISLAVLTPRILLHASVYLSAGESGMSLAACGVLLIGTWALLSWLSQRSPGVSIPIALGLSTQCAGLTVMMAGYIKGGAAAIPLVATLVATPLVTKRITKRWGAPSGDTSQGIIGIGVVGLFGLLFIGRFFGRISTGSALAMQLAPLLCWSTETPWIRNQKPWLVGSLRLALVAIPLFIVLALAKRDFDRDMAPLL